MRRDGHGACACSYLDPGPEPTEIPGELLRMAFTSCPHQSPLTDQQYHPSFISIIYMELHRHSSELMLALEVVCSSLIRTS